MSIFSSIFRGNKRHVFTPDFTKSEYDNWLDYLDNGGTSDEWKKLIKDNKWKFSKNIAEQSAQGKRNGTAWSDKNHKIIADKYFPQMHEIEEEWSNLYNLKSYAGERAKKFEQSCIRNIDLYKKMAAIERSYNQAPPPNAPAFKRLAMLYEKQARYEDAVSVCLDALISGAWGDGMRSRFARMIKKAGRTPTNEEMKLIDNE